MTLWILLVLLFAVAVVVGIWLHHLFEGEWLPHDLAREWQLSRLTLKELDRRWSEVPQKSDIVISLTTTPSRIDLIGTTLKSLLDQDLAPAKIVVNVPQFSRREQVPYEVPDWLAGLQAVQVRRCEDLGPATKVIPTVAAEPPDTPVLVVDDDRIYPAWLVDRYAEAAAEYPDHALTLAGLIVPEDLVDRPTTILSNLMIRPPAPIRGHRFGKPRPVDVLLGVFSYLVRPRHFDLEELRAVDADPEALFFVDDIRTSALCRAPKLVIPCASLSFIPYATRGALQRTRLGSINAGPGAHEARNNTIGIRHYQDRWQVGGPRGKAEV